jgi:uncharacterized membrane protein
MQEIRKHIDVRVPLTAAYNQWTQFESFPEFMDSVLQARQLDDRRVSLTVDVAGAQRSWEAEIVEQLPDERISWRSVSGTPNEGSVSFEPMNGHGTRIEVRIRWAPSGWLEQVAALLRLPADRLEGELERFREFIELRGVETGAWRGEIAR